MRLFVLGATGKTGSQLVDLALTKGHQVTAFVRTPGKITTVDKGLKVIQGSPDDVEGMAEAMKGHDAVFSALAPNPKEIFTNLKKRAWTMEGFALKTISAMEKAGVLKLVTFSSAGVFPQQNLFVRLLSLLARHHMKDLGLMDQAVSQSSRDWTIARPAWMGHGLDESYRAQVDAVPPKAQKMTFRALGKFVLDTVEGGLYKRQIVGLGK